MSEYLKMQMPTLIGMLKHTNLTKEDILCICGTLESDKAADEIVEMLRENKEDFKGIPKQQMFSMCVHILIKHQGFKELIDDDFVEPSKRNEEEIKQRLSGRADEYFMLMDD